MATQLQLRRGTTTEHSTFVGAVGEVTVDTTKDTLVVHDGATTAGFPLAKESTVTALDSAAVHKTGDETIAGTKTLSSNPVLSSGTANGVAYLNGSKVLTTGSALTFDGTNLGLGSSTINTYYDRTQQIYGTASSSLKLTNATAGTANTDGFDVALNGTTALLYNRENGDMAFGVNNVEGMRLTSTGLGIGTSSPGSKLDVVGSGNPTLTVRDGTTGNASLFMTATGSSYAEIQAAKYGLNFNMDLVLQRQGGNLGLGVTPSASDGALKWLQVSGTAIFSGQPGTEVMRLGSNWYYNGGFKYIGTGYAARYDNYQGQHQWHTAPSGTAGNAISFTQAMTLDANGNLGIGTSSPNNYGGSYKTLQVTGGSTSNGGVLRLTNSDSSRGGHVGIDSSTMFINTFTSTPITFGTSDTERMRIDSSGNLLVGTTAAWNFPASDATGVGASPSGYLFSTRDQSAALYLKRTGTNGAIAEFWYSTSSVGSISVTGSATAYNTSSDYRLKENIQPMQNALGVVAQLNPVTYTWKADGSEGQGFIAHELQAVVPDCVTGEKDAVDAEGKPIYQGIDTSFLVATLTKAIQEQQELINQLTARVAQLEGN